jgi:hypothetical protein
MVQIINADKCFSANNEREGKLEDRSKQDIIKMCNE